MKIANAFFEHNIHYELILSFDQTPLGFTAPNKATFAEKDAQLVPIANVDDKHQIADTFCFNISGGFLPIPLMYSGLNDRCHSKGKFSGSFRITHSCNHWSNELIGINYLKKIIFPLRKNAKTLLMFGVFKGQTKRVAPKE